MTEDNKPKFDPSAMRSDKDAEPGRPKGRRKRKVSYLTLNKIETVDYKEINILRRFLNDRGKILPSRQTGNTAKQQRMISNAIRQAREMALIPFVVNDYSAVMERQAARRERPPRDAAPAPVAETSESAE